LDHLFSRADDVPSAVIAAYRSGQFTMRQIADHLGVHYSTGYSLASKCCIM
jgi:transposase